MAKQLKLKIVTPERLVLEEMVDEVVIPTTEGEISVLPGHIPLIVGLASGDVVGISKGENIPMAVSGGFVEIKSRCLEGSEPRPEASGKSLDYVTEVAILADFAEHVFEISDEKIEKAKTRAEEMKVAMQNKEHVDFEHFEAELERSLTRVKIADKWRARKYRR
ncbi:hypothetical protein A2641_03225 [Candidatus Nomurabacteria bacterium RIFCSPHIGHO2_01_FULL_37_25]|uniref:ATP synthase epsilon chain n=1 Tax=Candidatus Nomurabacteria bacterium RIFCSPLOWO2_01_FULL_36_16 TaxID=1801767 RepID=A0A1F6WZK7_9BACT|nr:MAG: hypothetical protein A2641_03225 [Candidatus Nomurabacteria bacterium RIFCSPHIGHO2_01_FULL_37_25]OGI75501.1 MAG: hypothetical protein A3D36_02870 [Candidatus Nomurabacteria bacterium RIFCSPHIGHO2_02_FULL_36_29]OGI87339.1 MAG: hypothetical protein A3A91_02490 [Candidatus Nomurabacteria bacterium RIFCSPLOWO2_01_FULL_36_16]OGI94887.1 MAG: hypothetical protein A3I84_00550 [Candidatus Nomurabacteria bacterium RIFCSPLOWO2_02_FULL_36_8]